MKKFGKGMVITSTIAAALAAVTLAGCGNKTADVTKAETTKAVQASASTAVAEKEVKANEITADVKVETKQSYNTKADEVGTAGSNYYDNMGGSKSDEVGTAGSNYYANERTWEVTGELYEVTGKRLRIDISESNMGDGLFDVVVTASGSAFDSEVYGFLAHYDNETDTLVYDRGAKSCVSYNDDGTIAENYIIDEGHSGSISYTGAAGIRWEDSDGSSYVFMHDITFA